MIDPQLSSRIYRLNAPRAAAVAGILFAVLFSAGVVLIRVAVPENLTGYSGFTGIFSVFRDAGFVEVGRASETQLIMRYTMDEHRDEDDAEMLPEFEASLRRAIQQANEGKVTGLDSFLDSLDSKLDG